MGITIPKVVRPLPLTDYAPEFVQDGKPVTVYVWCNPPRAVRRERMAMLDDRKALVEVPDAERDEAWARKFVELGERSAQLFAKLWSAHADPTTHWTAEDVIGLSSNDTDPALFGWLTSRTLAMVDNYTVGAQGK